jgi:RNA polymerase sigma-70 factor (ECF subfamily)
LTGKRVTINSATIWIKVEPVSQSQRPFEQTAEALLVALAKTGDSAAFTELMHRRQSWIRNLMRRCCNDQTLADDLAQQVFFTAWRDIGQVRQANSFAGWLRRLAMNTWHQHQRKNDPLAGALQPNEEADASNSSSSIAMDLDLALAQLSAAERQCVVLSYHEGLSHSEIAELTALPLGTIKSHIRRGSQQLKEFLSDYWEQPKAQDYE